MIIQQVMYRRYRVLNLSTNKMSDDFVWFNNKMDLKPKFDRNINMYNNNDSEPIEFYDGIGMVVNTLTGRNKSIRRDKCLIRYDVNFKEIWKSVYDTIAKDKNRRRRLSYVKSDADAVVMFNHSEKRNGDFVNEFSLMIFDATNGKCRSEFLFPEMNRNAYIVKGCQMTGDKIFVFGNFSDDSDYGGINDKNNTGLFRYTFDRKSGKLLDEKKLEWKHFSDKLDINSSGYVSGEGYIYIHNMLALSNGKVIVVSETFKQDPVTVNNMYFIELTPDFAIGQVMEVDKYKNKFPGTVAHSSNIKKYGLFDFTDYQNLGDDDYLFFLNDNEKGSRNRKKSSLYGIVSYTDGKFTRQTLNLKTENSIIHPFNAKKGYLVMFENFDDPKKPTELRLEKINY
jgi:hypothetical protein